MKNIIRIPILLLLAFTIVSCEDFLTETPKSMETADTAYVDEDDASEAVTAIYNAFSHSPISNELGHCITTDISRVYVSSSYGGLINFAMNGETAHIYDLWVSYYSVVNIANTAISRIPQIEDSGFTDEERNLLLAEAKYLRSLTYFSIVRLWGDVPYELNETVDMSEAYDVKQTAARTILLALIEEVKWCEETLLDRSETESGHASKYAAKALLAHLYLTLGSMDKRDAYTGNGLDYFELCMEMSADIIDNGGFTLCDYYPDVFVPSNKNHNEMIFDIGHASGGIDDSLSSCMVGYYMGLGGAVAYGGSSNIIHATDYYHTIFEPNDQVRSYWNTPHITCSGTTLDTFGPTYYDESSSSIFHIGTFRRWPVITTDYVPAYWDCHWPVYRLGEILLFYAEADLELNKEFSSLSTSYLNKLRARATNINVVEGYEDNLLEAVTLDPYPRTISYGALNLYTLEDDEFDNYNEAFEYLQLERARELGGESRRWFDLIRWGTLVDRIQYLGYYIPENYDREVTEQDWDDVASFVRSYHMLWPIPTTEIRLNSNLKQNPGYN